MSAVALIENNTSKPRNRKLALGNMPVAYSTSVAFAAAKAIPPGEVASERQVTRLRVKKSR